MSKLLLIGIAALAAILMVGPFFLSAFVARDAIQKDVTAVFKAWSGLNVEVQGNTTVEGYPFPHVTIRSMVVHNVQEASSPFFLTIRTLELYPSWSALFSGSRTFSSVKLDGVNISLEQLKDHSFNWKKLNTQGTTDLLPFFTQNIHIDNASISYTDNVSGNSRTLDNIHMVLFPHMDSESDVKADFHYGNRAINAEGKVSGLSNVISSGTMLTNVTLESAGSQLTYNGEVGMKADNLYLKGEAALNTDDSAPWYLYLFKNVEDTSKMPPMNAKGVPYQQLPLQMHGTILSESSKTTLSDIELSGPVISGKLQATLDQSSHWQVGADLAEINLESILASRIFAYHSSEVASKPAMDSDSTTDNGLVMSADIKVASIDYNKQRIKDTHVAFDLENSEAVFSQASALFPGNSRFVFNGLGKTLDTGGISLEGQIDAAGDDFFAFTQLPKCRGIPLPAEDLKRFRIKANMVLSPKEIRLSELAARIEALAITGGIVIALDERPKAKAELSIAGINLDHFLLDAGLTKYIATLFSSDANREITLQEGQKTLQWLKDIDFDLTLSSSLTYVDFNGKTRSEIGGDLYVTPNKIAVNQLKTNYNNTQILAEMILDITNQTPRLSVVMNADSIDIPVSATEANSATSSQAGSQHWSTTPFNFYWLNHVDSTYQFTIDHVKYGSFQVDNLAIKGGLDNNILHVDDMKGIMLGAPFAARVSVRGGRIPAINLASNIENLQAEKIAPYITLLSSMTGNYTIALRLAMNGESMANWVSTLNGSVGIAGTNVLIHGFNMPGIIRAVAYVRTVADILNVVKHAFPGGDTLFADIVGNWTINEGKMDISNTKLSNPDANGIITGYMDLPSWNTQQKISFDLLALDRQKPPSISIQLRGNMDAPEKILDTHALEQYVTEKTSGRLLNSDNP